MGIPLPDDVSGDSGRKPNVDEGPADEEGPEAGPDPDLPGTVKLPYFFTLGCGIPRTPTRSFASAISSIQTVKPFPAC